MNPSVPAFDESIAASTPVAATVGSTSPSSETAEDVVQQRMTGVALLTQDLVQALLEADSLQAAGFELVNRLAALQGVHSAVLAIRRGNACRLVAISGVGHFDRHAEKTQIIESAATEVVLREEVCSVVKGHVSDLPTMQRWLHSSRAHSITGVPLVAGPHGPLACLLIAGPDLAKTPALQTLIDHGLPLVGLTLDRVRRAQAGWLRSTWARFRRHAPITRRWWWALLFMVAGLSLLPVPYRLTCDCRLEPVVRRVVAAPYDGVLQSSLVRVGDLVQQGDLLAQLDDRELRWELTSLEADRAQAEKKRDAALAARDVARAQLSRLDLERLEYKIRLWKQRSKNLILRSPIDGIVTSGDLQRVEGARLSKGETLFEIAPLDRMVVETLVRESEVAFVPDNAEVQIHLNAFPRQHWSARISQLHPRAEFHENQTVFVAEVPVDNTDRMLRPGMKGTAKIRCGRRPLVWVLLHRPWYYFVSSLGW